MKKGTSIVVILGLIVTLVGCGAESNTEVSNNETQATTILKDEMVSTTDKISVEEIEVEKTEEIVADKSVVEEKLEEAESLTLESEVDIQDSVSANGTESVEVANEVYADGNITLDDFAIQVNGILVSTGVDMNAYTEQLGIPDDFVQARSCLYDGDDKIYTYGGIAINTYPNGSEDIVYLIEVTGDEKLLSGIGLGSTVEDVEKAYGTGYVEFGTMLAYDLSETSSIGFQVEDGIVTFIEIYNE